MRKLSENLFEALLAELIVALIALTTDNKVGQLFFIVLGTLVSGTIAFVPKIVDAQSSNAKSKPTRKKSPPVILTQIKSTQSNIIIFWAQWVLTATTANLAAYFLSETIYNNSSYVWNTTLVLGSFIPTFSQGLFAGLFGWLILRKQIPNAIIWIPTSIVGYTIAGMLFVVWAFVPQTLINMYIVEGLAGVSIGLAQWWVLRKKFQNSIWCFPANIADHIIPLLLSALGFYELSVFFTDPTLYNEIVYSVLLSVSRSLISGVVIAQILSKSIQEQNPQYKI